MSRSPHRLSRELREAARHHKRGALAQAEATYRAILAQQPEQAGALHGMGLLALQAGRADLAIFYIGQAARIAPDDAGYHLDLGLALREQGHLEPARAAFHVASLLDPADAAPRAAMADMLARLHRLAEAASAYRDALLLAPRRPDLHHALALVLQALGRPREATEALRQAVALAPHEPGLRHDLAGALIDAGEPQAAERELRAVLARHPDHARALGNLALALQDLQRPAEALAAAQAAHHAAPEDLDIRNNLGVALRELDRHEDALECFSAVLTRDPAHAPAHLNAASVLLMRGDLAPGWAEFEWRDRVPGAAPHMFDVPRWQGEALEGRTLLVHAEQGFGDTIQFCRFVSRISGRVRLLVPQPLVRLLSPLAETASEPPDHFDLHCPLLSLPHLLGVTLDDVGTAVPYLRADPDAVARWRTRLDGRRIGVCWAGSDAYASNTSRSLPPDRLDAFAGAVSLQKGHRAPSGMADWTDELGDFADTAALIAALEVVVSVDTAVAHLAGALGKPVLLLDRFAGDWRWMRGRRDSPWYPGLRIFRQPAPGDWDSVLAELAAALT